MRERRRRAGEVAAALRPCGPPQSKHSPRSRARRRCLLEGLQAPRSKPPSAPLRARTACGSASWAARLLHPAFPLPLLSPSAFRGTRAVLVQIMVSDRHVETLAKRSALLRGKQTEISAHDSFALLSQSDKLHSAILCGIVLLLSAHCVYEARNSPGRRCFVLSLCGTQKMRRRFSNFFAFFPAFF